MNVYTVIINGLELIIFTVIVWKKLWREYFFFFFYFTFVFFVDLVGISLILGGIDTKSSIYVYGFWIKDIIEHLLRIMAVISLYKILLKKYPAIKSIVDVFFYLFCGVVLLVFMIRLDFTESFLYNAVIYFGKWSFFIVALISAFILIIVSLAGISPDRTYFWIVLGFLFYSIPQALNFFYLSVFYRRLSAFWIMFYQVWYVVPELMWFRGAILMGSRVKMDAPEFLKKLRPEIANNLRQIDEQLGKIIKKINPFAIFL